MSDTAKRLREIAAFCSDHEAHCGTIAGNDHARTCKAIAAEVEALEAENAALKAKLNTPELHDFMAGVPLEAAHQRERWGSEHDGGKTPADWFWLVGYLAGKALHAHTEGKIDKAFHHLVTTAAALANWHGALLGNTDMRPGIVPPDAMKEPKP